MPAIIVDDYHWRQNNDSVIVSMPILGHPKIIDLFAVGNYMKASYPPFILELFLWGTIVEESSECIIGDEKAIFTLRKEEIGVEWPSLSMQDLDKEKKRFQRSRALEIARFNAEERAKARSEKREALRRDAVRAQIDLDTRTLNEIQNLRDSHRRDAMCDLEDWRRNSEKPFLENLTGTIQENRNAYRPPTKWFDKNESSMRKIDSKAIISESEEFRAIENDEKEPRNSPREYCSLDEIKAEEKMTILPAEKKNQQDNPPSFSPVSSSSDSEIDDSNNLKVSIEKMNDEKIRREFRRRKKRESVNRGREIVRRVLSIEKRAFLGENRDGIFEENGAAIPRPRAACTIDVKFTERSFPTPARESHHLEEQEWLEKQAEARRKSGFVSEDLRPEEQDPQWLKDKGDEFFKAGNYLGAISAYTHGIKMSEKMSSLYVNRSAAHYAAGNYRRCCEDCSTALELMLPKCEANRESRARCHARLGAALCKLSAPQHGIPELEAALKLEPENESIKRDLRAARRYFEMKN